MESFRQSLVSLLLLVAIVNTGAITWNGAGTDTRWALQCDFTGRDLKNQASTSSQCGSLCKANPPCSHFTWTNYLGGTCWMKQGFVSEFDAVSKTNDGAVCGFLKTTIPATTWWREETALRWGLNCDFQNRDLMSKATTSGACGPTCQATPRCSHFVWTDYQGGTCWLKTGGASECDAIEKTDSNAMCGFLKY